MPKRRRHLLDLFVAEILARDKPAEHDAGIQRIRRDVATFIAGVDRAPIVKIQGAIPAAAGRGYRIAILLGAIYPVRKLVVRHHMVELPCWLVEPGTPCFSAVARHDRALIAAENHPARIAWCERYANSSKPFRWQSLPAHAFPMIASINRPIKPASRSVRGRVDAPWRPSRLPERCVNRFWISWFERYINRAGVFVMKQNLLPAL